jgi:hypothetical protein
LQPARGKEVEILRVNEGFRSLREYREWIVRVKKIFSKTFGGEC